MSSDASIEDVLQDVARRFDLSTEDVTAILAIEMECLDLDAATDEAVRRIQEYLEGS